MTDICFSDSNTERHQCSPARVGSRVRRSTHPALEQIEADRKRNTRAHTRDWKHASDDIQQLARNGFELSRRNASQLSSVR